MSNLARIIAETTSGRVEGRERDGALLFAGIPYAAPPVGVNRFRAPQPHEPWPDVRPASRFSPAAPQVPTGGLTSMAPVRWDEAACLTLNITTPAIDGAARPVFFWIHGGAYRTGQGAVPWYNGARFARDRNIVVVSINYRLGALGFTDLSRFGPDYATSGANGLLDQIAALRWVRDNIANFGGDPARVTIAGESAGAFSVCSLLASPLAKGLFRGAIPQSGGAQHTLPTAAGAKVADAFLAATGCRDIGALQALDAQAILDAQVKVIEQFGSNTVEHFGVAVDPFYPVEGNAVVPVTPLKAIAAGAGVDVAVLTGSNRHETTLWGYGEVDEERLERLAARLGAVDTLPVYREQRPHADAEARLIALTTDHMFRIPAIRLLEARERASGGAAAHWMYWFCWESRAFNGRLGATHALEIPFVFNNLDRAGVSVFLGPGERPDDIALAMHDAWARFIHTQDPGWSAYDSRQRATMVYNDVCEVVADPDGAERRAWDGRR